MAVVYMAKLEECPATYSQKFTKLTKGTNIEVQNWILSKIFKEDKVLELGCGPGDLAFKIAKKSKKVVAVDNNKEMVNFAVKRNSSGCDCDPNDLDLFFYQGSVSNSEFLKSIQFEHGKFDTIVSTFLLTELRPLEQQILLRSLWNILKPDGMIIFAAEFVPKGMHEVFFRIKRKYYKRKTKIMTTGLPHPTKRFEDYLEPIGYHISEERKWLKGAIKGLIIKKKYSQDAPGYYLPEPIQHSKFKTWFRKLRCILTGQVDHVCIEPGLYRIGNPGQNSPILVSCNYEYTYHHLSSDIKGLNVWLLIVDSNGINVWCAARGNNFGNKQLLEIVEATPIKEEVTSKVLFLPQLCAGGVSAPQLPMNSDIFPFEIMYGPIWSKDLHQYLEKKPKFKPKSMKTIEFSPFHRFRATITHTSFLLRKVFGRYFLIALIISLAISQFHLAKLVGLFLFNLICINLLIGIFFPITRFTRKFLTKSKIFGVIGWGISFPIAYLIFPNVVFDIIISSISLWFGFFSTMSFSGYTMESSPNEIKNEYPIFTRWNKILKYISLIILFTGFLLYWNQLIL